MTRRLLQNVAAIEKDLNLAPTSMSQNITTIHEDEDEQKSEEHDNSASKI